MNRLAASLDRLNEGQRRAVMHGPEPLLVIAGAGTGKTTTLAHRVARLIDEGANPARILLLTFARRAAAEMLRRVDALLGRDGSGGATAARVWGGTFHAIGARLLRLHGAAIGLPPDFTVLDRADAEDLLDVVRTELGLGATDRSDSKRFPRKGTALAIYSRCVNARTPLEELLARQYPWCRDAAEDLKRLFRAFGDRKAEQAVLDYDDLLLWLHALLADPVAGEAVRARFDRVLVDEYQDTNRLQAEIVKLLRPGGDGLTVVGDDAQSIYSFRGATVRNILDFPREWPGGAVVKLEDNYRSTPQLVEATNRIIGCAPAGARFEKTLRSPRRDGPRPLLVTCFDEDEQTAFVVRTILEQREAGVALRRQAVLFRAAHHSTSLELELGRRNVPFHKYGGLKFLEAAHVKDVVGFLRLIENPRDLVAGTRTLQLLPGVGPKRARALMDAVAERSPASFEPWREGRPHSESWAGFVDLVRELSGPAPPELPAQLHRIRAFYAPLVERRFDDLDARLRDLEQLEQLAARYADRRQFLAEMALDPPSSTQDLAGPPLVDEDWLVLSTIHSAKGLEWDAVYVIHAADGNIPSDLATGHAEEIEEERRLFYVATSRARDQLYVTCPLRYYRRPGADAHSYAQLTRFLPREVRAAFDERTIGEPAKSIEPAARADGTRTADAIRERLRAMWS